MKCDAVFEGGGVKGVAFIGAIQETERRGYQFNRLAGTSAGALVASLLAAGYTGKELETYVDELTLTKFLDKKSVGKIPYIGNGLSILFYNGIYCGERLQRWVSCMLKEKGISTFGDLAADKLKIVASDISRGKILILPDDLEQYQIDWKTFSVSQAVRMSCAIPYFFQPAVLRFKNKRSYIVDGGILSNYPVWIFDTKSRPRWPTIGYRLRGADQEESMIPIYGPISMLSAIFSTMREAHDRLYISKKDAARTMFIPVEDVATTDFRLSEKQKNRLIQLGREEAQEFFEKWDFSSYIKEHRKM